MNIPHSPRLYNPNKNLEGVGKCRQHHFVSGTIRSSSDSTRGTPLLGGTPPASTAWTTGNVDFIYKSKERADAARALARLSNATNSGNINKQERTDKSRETWKITFTQTNKAFAYPDKAAETFEFTNNHTDKKEVAPWQ